jgi:hypothetical protein
MTPQSMVAALFVEMDGVYWGLAGVDPWDEMRDARLYAGPHPVVAHPPCERWGRYWSGGPSAKVRRKKGDDGGCFASALESVRRWGGDSRAPRGVACLEALWADTAEFGWGMEHRRRSGVDVSGRTRPLRAQGAQEDVALRRGGSSTVAHLGAVDWRTSRRRLSLSRGAQGSSSCRREASQETFQGGESHDPFRVPRRTFGSCSFSEQTVPLSISPRAKHASQEVQTRKNKWQARQEQL